jgi:oligopeptidase B
MMGLMLSQFRWSLAAGLLVRSACQTTGGANLEGDAEATAIVVSLDSPPQAPKVKHSFTHHGITVRDDYNWLRDPRYPKVGNPAILDYLEQENAYFDAWMAPQQALVSEIYEELKARQPKEDESVPYRDGDFWYKWRYADGAQYRIWFQAPIAAPDNWAVLLDENQLAGERDYFRLGMWSVSPDGRILAYSADTSGAERFRIYLVDLGSGQEFDYSLENTAAAIVWSGDSRSLLYTGLHKTEWRSTEVWRHRLRSVEGARGDDELVYREINDLFRLSLGATQSKQYALLSSGDHVTSEVRVLDLNNELARPKIVAPAKPGHLYEVDHRGQYFYILTNDSHPNFRVVRTPESKPGMAHWQTVIAPSSQVYITGVTTFADAIVVQQRQNGLDQIRVLDGQHRSHLIEFPESSYTVRLSSNANYQVSDLRLVYESMVTPDTVFDYSLSERRLRALKVQEIPSGYDANNYVTQRLSATARDGTQVPISLVMHKNYVADGTAPLWLYGYGAYGVVVPPSFSTNRLSILDRGFAFAIAHIRGGNDLGDAWYQAGKLKQRNNTFNDFVDVAKHLVTLGYGRPGNIAISGGSAGGELMGAVVNQAPELWGAVGMHVPFVDVLNTMLDASLPLTPLEWPEWGNPVEDAEAFEFIRSYSPYDQLQAGTYPPMLVTGGLNDPRVTYWEPTKYVAKLRTLKRGDSPLLLKINMGAGHGGKTGRFGRLQEIAEEYAFALTTMQPAEAER